MVEVIDYVQTSNIVEDNQLVKCGLLVINQSLGTKKKKKKKKKRKTRRKKNHSGKEELSQI